jgi:hypothetical protein
MLWLAKHDLCNVKIKIITDSLLWGDFNKRGETWHGQWGSVPVCGLWASYKLRFYPQEPLHLEPCRSDRRISGTWPKKLPLLFKFLITCYLQMSVSRCGSISVRWACPLCGRIFCEEAAFLGHLDQHSISQKDVLARTSDLRHVPTLRAILLDLKSSRFLRKWWHRGINLKTFQELVK